MHSYLPKNTKRPLTGFFILAVVMVFSAGVQSGDYLSEIEAETIKLDTGLQMDSANQHVNKAGNQTKGETSAEMQSSESMAASDDEVRLEFEKKLKDKYRGSYIFYTKLPLRSREEMVQEYVRGTSFVKIRSKIVNRYMNR